MNYKSLARPAVVAWIVDGIYGYVVFGIMLQGEFARYPGVFRSIEVVNGLLPLLFAGTLLAMFAMAYMYAKGYEGGSGVEEGLRFGVLVGLFLVGYVAITNYVTLNVGRRIAAVTTIAGFIEIVIDGIVIGALHKGAPPARSVQATRR